MIRLSKYNMTNGKQGFIALFQNISELENMAQELATIKTLKSLLQTVIEHSYDGLVMINADGKITFTSPHRFLNCLNCTKNKQQTFRSMKFFLSFN